jgi:hypothetical protein
MSLGKTRQLVDTIIQRGRFDEHDVDGLRDAVGKTTSGDESKELPRFQAAVASGAVVASDSFAKHLADSMGTSVGFTRGELFQQGAMHAILVSIAPYLLGRAMDHAGYSKVATAAAVVGAALVTTPVAVALWPVSAVLGAINAASD